MAEYFSSWCKDGINLGGFSDRGSPSKLRCYNIICGRGVLAAVKGLNDFLILIHPSENLELRPLYFSVVVVHKQAPVHKPAPVSFCLCCALHCFALFLAETGLLTVALCLCP